MNPLLASIQWIAFPFAPSGWATCDGQLMPVEQFPALFSLIGTTYGGDGTETFALPDLMSTMLVGAGQSRSALSSTNVGQIGQVLQPPSAGVTAYGTLGMLAIICLEGIFPQRP